jgi:hypothetical protein
MFLKQKVRDWKTGLKGKELLTCRRLQYAKEKPRIFYK